jgi:hypothetical protein
LARISHCGDDAAIRRPHRANRSRRPHAGGASRESVKEKISCD